MNWENTDPNRRLLDLMAEQAAAFDRGTCTLLNLIDDLRNLLDQLESPDTEWRSSFLDAWSRLELTYAVMLDRGESHLSPHNRNVVNDALRSIRGLLPSTRPQAP